MSVDLPDPVVAKRLLICDSIEKRNDGGVNLINLWLLRRLPKGWTPTSVLPPWAAFAWVTNGRGRVRFRLYVAPQQTNGRQNHIWSSPIQEILFSDPIETFFLSFSIAGLAIDAPGDHLVELHCEDKFGSMYFLDDILVTFAE